MAAGRNSALSSSVVEIFSPRDVIRAPVSTNHLAGVNPGAGVAGGKVHCTCDLVQSTVPLESLFEVPYRACLGSICSIFYVVTQPILCIKVEA